MSARALRWLTAAVIVAGTIYTMSMVRTDRRIIDTDEAAWIFNGYFLDLYASGDWDPAKWSEFDKYAQHPPAGKYLFGALMHAVGEPVRSMEPRRYWFENDMYTALDLDRFLNGIYERLSYRQLKAARYMAAALSALSALLLFVLARGLAGTAPALVGYVLLVTHPMFRATAEIASADSFLQALAILAVILSLKLGRAARGPAFSAAVWALALALVLGLSFSTKIVAFAFVAPCLFAAAFACPGPGSWMRSLMLALAASLAGLAVLYLLDPGLHGDLIGRIHDRISMRIERIGIQEVIFAGERLRTAFDRGCFLIGHLFFSSRIDMVLFAPTLALGLLAPAFLRRGSDERRASWLAIALAVFFGLLIFMTLPMALTRYVALAVPFVVLVAAMGVRVLAGMASEWGSRSGAQRKGMLACVLLSALVVAAISQWLGPAYCRVPRGSTPEEDFIGRIFAYSILEPCNRPKIHEILYEHFKRTGNEGWAVRQLICLEGMPKRP